LNAPPEIPPTAWAPTATVKPIGSPKYRVALRAARGRDVQNHEGERERDQELGEQRGAGVRADRGRLRVALQEPDGETREQAGDHLDDGIAEQLGAAGLAAHVHGERDRGVVVRARDVASGIDHHHERGADHERRECGGARLEQDLADREDQEERADRFDHELSNHLSSPPAVGVYLRVRWTLYGGNLLEMREQASIRLVLGPILARRRLCRERVRVARRPAALDRV